MTSKPAEPFASRLPLLRSLCSACQAFDDLSEGAELLAIRPRDNE